MIDPRNKGEFMRYTDIAIVGGGLAGATAAAMLGRAGIAAIMIDPHTTYPPDLRCEKLGGTQLRRLHRTGLDEEYYARRRSTAKFGRRGSVSSWRKDQATSTA
jgi:2-polyprenyl-6-methoxyphenol hydroxylase-like FAD-dependent oxidoreductase